MMMLMKGGWMVLLFCLVRLAKSQANKVLLLIALAVLSGLLRQIMGTRSAQCLLGW